MPSTDAAGGDPGVALVVALERRLLDPVVRAQPDEVRRLLHPDAVEHGRSGRVWTAPELVEALGREPGVPGRVVDVRGTRLAPDVVLLTYRVEGPRASVRCSVWVHEAGHGWRLRFHQGTPSA